MDLYVIALRILHIVFGVFWAGAAMYFAFILQPRLRALGPAIQGPVMAALAPIMGPTMTASGTITIVAGALLAIRLDFFDRFPDTAWGWAIFLGLVLALAAMVSGMTTMVSGNRMVSLGRKAVDGGLSPEEGAEMTRLGARLPRLGYFTAIVVLVAIGTMASARYV